MKRSWFIPPSENILGTIAAIMACASFCAMLSYMIVSTHESMRIDMHMGLSRMEEQLQSMQTSLEMQQQLLFMHASDARMAWSMRQHGDDMSVVSDPSSLSDVSE